MDMFVTAFQAYIERVAALGICFLALSAVALTLIIGWFRARNKRNVARRHAQR
jgi:hypothetical protein